MRMPKSRGLYQRGRLILMFEPCDFWVGGFYDSKRRALYVCLIPCLPIRWRLGDW